MPRARRATRLALLCTLLWMVGAQGAHSGHEPVGSLALSDPVAAWAESGEPTPSLLVRFRAHMGDLFARIGVDAEFARLYARWVVGAPVLVVSILIAMLLRRRGTVMVSTTLARTTDPGGPSTPTRKRPAVKSKTRPKP